MFQDLSILKLFCIVYTNTVLTFVALWCKIIQGGSFLLISFIIILLQVLFCCYLSFEAFNYNPFWWITGSIHVELRWKKSYSGVSLHCPPETEMKAQNFLQFCVKDEIMIHLHKWGWHLVITGNETEGAWLPEKKRWIEQSEQMPFCNDMCNFYNGNQKHFRLIIRLVIIGEKSVSM